MLASDAVQALSIISEIYPDAKVAPAELPDFLMIERPDHKPMLLHQHLLDRLNDLGFKYSARHGACWYANI